MTVFDTSEPAWTQLLAGAPAFAPHRTVGVDDTFMMIFTSGTSGDPKAVQVANLMPLFAGNALAERFELTSQDTCYLSMPMFHSNAVVGGWAPALVAGAAMVPAKFSASRFLSDIRRYGVTYMNYVGKPLATCSRHPNSPTTGTTRCASRSATRPPIATSRSSHGGSTSSSTTASAPPRTRSSSPAPPPTPPRKALSDRGFRAWRSTTARP